MSTYVTIDPEMISSPPHYVKDRKIEPIDVIEEWSFCHHLACVVKYVARAGRKNPILQQARLEQTRLEDLKKAEWYLMREIEARPCPRIPRLRRFPTAPEVIAKDWCLSSSLKEVISYLTVYQKLFYRFPFTKIICLKQALTHLGTEIKIWEGNDTRVPANQSRHSSLLQQADFRGTNIIIFKGARAKDARVKGGEKPCCNKPE